MFAPLTKLLVAVGILFGFIFVVLLLAALAIKLLKLMGAPLLVQDNGRWKVMGREKFEALKANAPPVPAPDRDAYPYEKTERMLTPAEAWFSRTLIKAIGDDWAALVKIRLADVFRVTIQGKGYMPAFNRIAKKHVDFLLIDPETTEPLLGIELDDRSHQRADRIKRDEFVDRAFESAELPLLRVVAARDYDTATLRRQIAAILRPVEVIRATAPTPQPVATPADSPAGHPDARYMPK